MVDTASAHSNGYSEESSIQKVQVASDSRDYVIFGNLKIYRHELQAALMDSIVVQQPYTPSARSKFANPGPLGLCAFGISTLVLCLINAGAYGMRIPNAAVGLACFFGGAIQLFAGVWEFFVGNTFGFTALTSYGAFWLAWAAIQIPSFGIKAAYTGESEQYATAAGFFLTGWAIFTFMLTLLTFKSSVAFCALFSCLTITFIFLAAGDFTGIFTVTRVGGIFGVITAVLAFYNAFAATATKQNSYIRANVIPLSK
ncbi:uncharacterized protein LODBEIA_P05250 [Lodderomyces beijingensis]|uniref:Uncharacterized protein n=1 Tax=Lodderomyces beijingensis TaxID=1775926 RepID=A0ABP0ZHJ1_9ASCO